MGRRNNKVKDDSAFQNMPPEMCFRIFSNLDAESFRAVRGVSKRWKFLADSSRNISFTCHLTDITTTAVINSNESFSCIKIHDFEGRDNKIVSATRGTGRILGCAESIHLIGSNINATEIGKMMQYAVRSVNELLFHHCHRSVLQSVFDLHKPFESLRKLTMCQNYIPSRRDTRILQNLGSVAVAPKLPLLEHLKIVYELDNLEEVFALPRIPSANEVFTNYLAVARLVFRYKDTLKIVEIQRNEILRTALMLNVEINEVRLSQSQRYQIQECLEGFQTTKLDVLHISPLLDEEAYPWNLETSLMKQQRCLKELTYDRKLCFPFQHVNQSLVDSVPDNRHFFTSIKISFTCSGNMPVDLSLFSQCPSLKTLWLLFYRGVRVGLAGMNTLRFTNLQQLPKTITNFHLKSSQDDPIIIHQQSLLTREQMRWIIDNLRDLESIWLQLVTEEVDEEEEDDNDMPDLMPADENDNNRQMDENAPELVFEQLLNPHDEELNAQNANIDVQMFRELISMPKLRDMKFDMLKARQLDANIVVGADGHPWVVPMQHARAEDILEYINIIRQDATITFIPNEVLFFPIRFIEFSLTRDK
ncbi:hypothetical protein Ocin01_06190 [Orchesella cincta]|uniref:F-box domain-containing protein n=1 Tax=Orchesella cincta TaxID=48709 RepID=A0A1D2N5I4_ORCCI|nr:hypothetical protein Ocin01_06190 [Orchesella cincta]